MTDNDWRHVGEMLRILRVKAGYSRAKLAKRTRISEKTIKNLEQGSHKPRAYTLHQIGEVLGFQLVPDELWEVAKAIQVMDPETTIEELAEDTRITVKLIVLVRRAME